MSQAPVTKPESCTSNVEPPTTPAPITDFSDELPEENDDACITVGVSHEPRKRYISLASGDRKRLGLSTYYGRRRVTIRAYEQTVKCVAGITLTHAQYQVLHYRSEDVRDAIEMVKNRGGKRIIDIDEQRALEVRRKGPRAACVVLRQYQDIEGEVRSSRAHTVELTEGEWFRLIESHDALDSLAVELD